MDEIDEAVERLIESHWEFAKAVAEDSSRKKQIRKWVEAFRETNSRLPDETEMNPAFVMNKIEGVNWSRQLFDAEYSEKAGVLFRMTGKRLGNTDYYSDEGAGLLAKLIDGLPGEKKVVDIGTAGKMFIQKVVEKLKSPEKVQLLTTNFDFPEEYIPEKGLKKDETIPYYDVISDTPKLDLSDAHVVIVKDVLKFYPKTRQKAFDRIVSKMKHGSVLVTGEMQALDGKIKPKNPEHDFSGMNMHFHVIVEDGGKKQAVEVSPRRFTEELLKTRGYLPKVHEITNRVRIK